MALKNFQTGWCREANLFVCIGDGIQKSTECSRGGYENMTAYVIYEWSLKRNNILNKFSIYII